MFRVPILGSSLGTWIVNYTNYKSKIMVHFKSTKVKICALVEKDSITHSFGFKHRTSNPFSRHYTIWEVPTSVNSLKSGIYFMAVITEVLLPYPLFCPKHVFLCCVWFSRCILIIPLNNITLLAFVTGMRCVICVTETTFVLSVWQRPHFSIIFYQFQASKCYQALIGVLGLLIANKLWITCHIKLL
jgi:hypothetical protein